MRHNFKTNRNKFLIAVAFSLFFYGFIVLPSFAQITSQGRDQTYKQVFPLGFDERFKRRAQPKAQKVPVREDNPKPEVPGKLRKVKFILQKMIIKGSTLYNKDRFSKLYKKYIRKRISLGYVYEIDQKITNMYRHDGYILSKAVVRSQQVDQGIIRIDIIEGFFGKVNIQRDIVGPRKHLNSYRKKL